jgi:hypothetical protein
MMAEQFKRANGGRDSRARLGGGGSSELKKIVVEEGPPRVLGPLELRRTLAPAGDGGRRRG